MENVIELFNISKHFGKIKANDNISISLRKGEIHAILGENGAGKSTLMSILFGLYEPDSGKILRSGKEVKVDNPNVARDLGIGMVHQHFKLVDNFTTVQNIVLGMEPRKFGRIDWLEAEKQVKELSERYGLNIDLKAKVEDTSVGMQQRVEILKMLYRDAEILIFDEPTAVLTPQEIEELLQIFKVLISEGKSIILITHKLNEIKQVADRFSVLRRGRYIGTYDVESVNKKEMAELMVGREVDFTVEKDDANPSDVILELQDVVVLGNNNKKVVNNVSFSLKRGEILGIVGIEGNGQTDLVHAISGLKPVASGKIILDNEDITYSPVKKRIAQGMSHIPEDRHKHGLVLDFTLEENFILHHYKETPFSKNGFLNHKEITSHAEELEIEFDVRTASGVKSVARGMSGGNQQKAIIAREIRSNPHILLAVQPTRGLDVGAIEYIHKRLIEQRDMNKAVLLVSLEIDEVLNVADRILVIFDGEITGELNPKETDENELGLLMASKGGRNE